MANIRPFKCIRPRKDAASRVAALPYDVYNRKEAKEAVAKEELSFLKIDRAETQFDDSVEPYDDRVYLKAREILDNMIAEGILVEDNAECYYLYELKMGDRRQTGIVACASIDDYLNNRIKKHENTREDKEIDRIRHVDTCSAQTGPIFLAYRAVQEINEIVDEAKELSPVYDFVSEDGIGHRVWKMDASERIAAIKEQFGAISDIYIADGHHRAASAVKVGLKRRAENPDYDGGEEFNYFLSVLFPDEQLKIMDYNRAVRDLNGHTREEFLEIISEDFELEEMGKEPFQPPAKGVVGMFLAGSWYKLTAKKHLLSTDPVEGLDVSILQNHLLAPVLGVMDPRTDKRIDFIGGIRGLKELEKRCQEDMTVAFAMYPTQIEELFSVADAGRLMPPKSTWFEPKLRSGLFIHRI
ncbi:DUF1015 domain-containing protein [Parasporobacterium paucivorans]|uniref:Uncharacterized conserved protein, DUF1015 family n=1 Tax=Parasporobacterium paucivorans DSM 15970 TaxID=1122934 RepID=A0A1M6C3M0_9FIRM|nr:DUF1015 family protein [Parasporobacterium paucivorans]SHI55543.1 Uncharacterized conserved protein, DUF1015 family [Parasporobacterium paucivorans DSM 15970]